MANGLLLTGSVPLADRIDFRDRALDDEIWEMDLKSRSMLHSVNK